MKFTVFVLIFGLSLVAANVELPSPIEEFDFEYIANDIAEDVTDIDSYVSWFGIYFVIRKALTTLKGVNCTIKEVVAIKGSAQNFIDDVNACGDDVSKKVQQLIDACNDIISTSNDIINLDENVCGNSVDTDDETAAATLSSRTSFKCFVKLLRKTLKLKSEVKHAISLIKKINKVPGDTSDCVNTAVNTLSSVFTEFPSRVKTCSKLVN